MPLLCRNIIKYFLDRTVPTALVAEVLTAGRVKAFVTPTGEVQQKPVVDDSTDDQESPALTKAVAQLRVNLGHPSNDALARAIRLAGGSDAAIKTALKTGCTICNRLREPSSIPPASLRKWKEFGECVAIDLSSLGDSGGEPSTFFNMLNMASCYNVVFPISDKNPITVFYGFLMGCCMTLGIP